MTPIRVRTSLLVAALATALLAGCGSNGDPGRGGGDEGGGEPVAGGSLTFSVVLEPPTLDPAAFSNSYAQHAVWGNALFGTLLEMDDDGSVDYRMIESLENRDDTLWLVHLREGLTFSDGTPLDAAALKYNWDRDKDRTVAHAQTVAAASAIAETTVVDGTTLQVTMARPTAHLASLVLAMNFVGSPTALAAGPEAFTAHPVGAGPFVLESWTRQDRAVLAKNPDYWDAPRPYLDELVIRADPDDAQRWTALQAGETDIMISNSFETADLAGDAGFAVLPADVNGFTDLSFNFSRAPFDDPRAREAIELAVDRQQLNDTLYGGTGEVPDGLFRESSPLYDDSVTFPDPDPERAQDLLDELAADGKPLSFTIRSSTNSDVRRAGEAIQAQLRAYDNLGVAFEPEEAASLQSRLAQNDYEANITGVSMFDPSPLLEAMLGTGSPTNFNRIALPELDTALQRGRLAEDTAERRDAYAEVMRILVDQHALVAYTRIPAFLLATGRVHGADQYAGGSPTVDGIWLDPEA